MRPTPPSVFDPCAVRAAAHARRAATSSHLSSPALVARGPARSWGAVWSERRVADRPRRPVRRSLPATVLVLACVACAPERAPSAADRDAEASARERTIELVPRTPHLATYPCAQCHQDRVPDPTPRALREFHAGRVVTHGPALAWCERCHVLEEPDSLRLIDGTRVSFDASDAICGQCHGPEHADWEAGMHGLSRGGWRGTVRRPLCTACHDPHAPGPLTFEALPPPEGEAGRARHGGGHGSEGAAHEGGER